MSTPAPFAAREPSFVAPRRRWVGVALVTLVVAASGLTQAAEASEPWTDELVIPFDLDDDAAAWARVVAPPELSPLRRLRAISRALLDPRQVGMQEALDRTPTASEAYRWRTANCVGFASLFVGLARAAGVPAFFAMVEDLGRRRRADLLITEGHLVAAWGRPDRLRIFDFAGESDGRDYRVLPITDLTAIALFHSNRGVESMLEDRDAEAERWLRRAVTLDPTLAAARINLGVALRRLGDLEGAELAYQEALRIDPGASAAARSLAALWRLRGRSSEADALVADVNRVGQDGALSYLTRARRSLAIGRVEQARNLYRKALELSSQPR